MCESLEGLIEERKPDWRGLRVKYGVSSVNVFKTWIIYKSLHLTTTYYSLLHNQWKGWLTIYESFFFHIRFMERTGQKLKLTISIIMKRFNCLINNILNMW